MVQKIAVRVTTARKLMHEKLEGRSNRGPHRSRKEFRILNQVGTLKAALISGQASATAMQCVAEFKIYRDSRTYSFRFVDIGFFPSNDAAGGTSRLPLPTVEDYAERNDRVPPERTAV